MWVDGFPKALRLINPQHTYHMPNGQQAFSLYHPFTEGFPGYRLSNSELQAGSWLPSRDLLLSLHVSDVQDLNNISPYFAWALVPGSQVVGPLETGSCSFFLHWLYQLLKREPGNLDSQHEW